MGRLLSPWFYAIDHMNWFEGSVDLYYHRDEGTLSMTAIDL
jgi:hypothetical protein